MGLWRPAYSNILNDLLNLASKFWTKEVGNGQHLANRQMAWISQSVRDLEQKCRRGLISKCPYLLSRPDR